MFGNCKFRVLGTVFMVMLTMAGNIVKASEEDAWRRQAVRYARILSRLKWSPVTNGIPIRGKGEFRAGTRYTGVPYSNGGWDGRMIGFDINLRTYLAAVENPRSVIYTTDLRGQRNNSAGFYGTVCSGFTSYALQLAMQVGSSFHGPEHRKGVESARPQSAQGARVGDILWSRGHVEIVTRVAATPEDGVTRVRVEDSWSPTTRTRNYTARQFDDYLAQRKGILYRIADHDAWRGENRAERYLFPNYALDAATATVNRVLLLDLGDWVPYRRDQPVAFNIMDRDNQGVEALVIQRGGEQIAKVPLEGPGVVERTFARPGDYTAHCIMTDGTASQTCEFSVCALEFRTVPENTVAGQPLEIEFHAENIRPIHLSVSSASPPNYAKPVVPHAIWLNDEHRSRGRVTIPAAALAGAGQCRVVITGENRYGRLRSIAIINVTDPE